MGAFRRILASSLLFACAAAGVARAQLVAPIRITNAREFTGMTFQHIPLAFECIDFENVYDKPVRAFDLSIEFVDASGKSTGKRVIHRTGTFAPGVEITAPKNPNVDGTDNCYRLQAPGDAGVYRLRMTIDHAEFTDGSEWSALAQPTASPGSSAAPQAAPLATERPIQHLPRPLV